MIFNMEVLTDTGYISLLPLAWLMLAVALAVLWFRSRNRWHLLFAAVFGVYLVFAIAAVFFPIRMGLGQTVTFQAVVGSINLVPFNYDFSFIPHLVWQQIFQNILLTVPFGFGISFVARLKPKDFLWLVPAVGIGLELAELAMSLLLRIIRTIDINDVILNSLGVLIGYLLFRMFAWLYLRLTHRFGLPRSGLLGYVYDVAARASAPSGQRSADLAAF